MITTAGAHGCNQYRCSALRTPGAPCEVGAGVATSPDGKEMFCLGKGPDTNVWTVLIDA
ncbi:hypothetical protein ATK86_7401 [Nocardia fluminea]|uniref:Uncharacterized protein n=1 Tax=Nocardia fluminea TaxID=134984 RepID=A0A2N3V4H6_9NOCA|nr:hypothetical protein ATK86_7401 [Nocardia fluminea]